MPTVLSLICARRQPIKTIWRPGLGLKETAICLLNACWQYKLTPCFSSFCFRVPNRLSCLWSALQNMQGGGQASQQCLRHPLLLRRLAQSCALFGFRPPLHGAIYTPLGEQQHTLPQGVSGQPGSRWAAQALALECAYLLHYVSLNMAAVRKILKRMAACVAPLPAAPGQLALQISDPHDAKWTLLQVLPTNPEPCCRRLQGRAPGGRARAAGAADPRTTPGGRCCRRCP